MSYTITSVSTCIVSLNKDASLSLLTYLLSDSQLFSKIIMEERQASLVKYLNIGQIYYFSIKSNLYALLLLPIINKVFLLTLSMCLAS